MNTETYKDIREGIEDIRTMLKSSMNKISENIDNIEAISEVFSKILDTAYNNHEPSTDTKRHIPLDKLDEPKYVIGRVSAFLCEGSIPWAPRGQYISKIGGGAIGLSPITLFMTEAEAWELNTLPVPLVDLLTGPDTKDIFCSNKLFSFFDLVGRASNRFLFVDIQQAFDNAQLVSTYYPGCQAHRAAFTKGLLNIALEWLA